VRASGAPQDVLTDRNLEDVYRVKALTAMEGETRFVVPLSRTE